MLEAYNQAIYVDCQNELHMEGKRAVRHLMENKQASEALSATLSW